MELDQGQRVSVLAFLPGQAVFHPTSPFDNRQRQEYHSSQMPCPAPSRTGQGRTISQAGTVSTRQSTDPEESDTTPHNIESLRAGQPEARAPLAQAITHRSSQSSVVSHQSSVLASQPPRPDSQSDWRHRLPFYYGWIIALACALTLGFAYTTWYSFSVFFVALIQEFGWSRAASAGVFSFFVIVVGLSGAVAGALADKYGPGKVGTVGSLILGLGLIACSQMTSLWQFYLFFGIVTATGLASAGWIPSVTMVSRWFSARYGTAIGIASAGIGVGILIMVPVTQMVIDSSGWRTAYLVLAAVAFLLILPVQALLLRGRPEDLGLLRDGRKPAAKSVSRDAVPAPSRIVDKAWAERVWSVGNVVRTRRYWFIFFMLALGNISSQMLMVHQVAFLVDGGYEKLFAASAMGLVGFFSIFAKMGWGWASDRLGREITWTAGFACIIVGIGLLALTRVVPSAIVVYIYALLFALGYGVAPPLGPAAASDVFAGRRFGSIYGTLGVGNAIGSGAGAFLAGLVFDLTGGYNLAFIVAAATALLSIVFMWIAAPRRVRVVPGQAKRVTVPGE